MARRTWPALGIGACALGLAAAFIFSARAQTLPEKVGVSLVPPPVFTERGNPFAVPNLGEGLSAADWLVYPSIFAGVSADTNPQQAPTSSRFGTGLRTVPSIIAFRETGIHTTTLYGAADAQYLVNANNDNILSADAGFTQIYRVLPDLIFNAQGDFSRQQNIFSNFLVNNSLTTLNPTGVGLSPTVGSPNYDQFSGTASVQKNLDDAFVILGGSAVALAYEHAPNAVTPAPNGTTYTAQARIGVWLLPDLYSYLGASVDTRDFGGSLGSSGYRVTSGIGSDRFGLFRGELYAGYQSERYRSAAIGTVSGVLLGGRLLYYPLPELAVGGALDEVIGATSLVSTPGSPLGTATKVTSFLGQASYALAREWSASARGGYIHTDYVGSIRRDDALTIGITITYTIWRTLGLTLDYQHLELTSNAALQGFSRDVVTVGALYRY
jgi:hypothetical protein